MIERVKNAMVGLGATWVLVLMILLSILSLAVMLERAYIYFSVRDDIEKLIADFGRCLRSNDRASAQKVLEASPSAEAAVVLAGMMASVHGSEAAERAMDGALAMQRLKLEKRLAFLGTVGNNAPFIGLLGTVIGIVGAFDELKKNMNVAGPQTQLASGGVMASIAEALVATAVGLVVAIPAVAAYNYFQRIVKATQANTEALGNVLLSSLAEEEEKLAPSFSKAPSRSDLPKSNEGISESASSTQKVEA